MSYLTAELDARCDHDAQMLAFCYRSRCNQHRDTPCPEGCSTTPVQASHIAELALAAGVKPARSWCRRFVRRVLLFVSAAEFLGIIMARMCTWLLHLCLLVPMESCSRAAFD